MGETYRSAERILLLIRAMNTPDGQTWEEVTAQVPGYSRDPIAGQRMFLRDLLLLEKLDFQVERGEEKRDGERKHLYRLVRAERFFLRKRRRDLLKVY